MQAAIVEPGDSRTYRGTSPTLASRSATGSGRLCFSLAGLFLENSLPPPFSSLSTLIYRKSNFVQVAASAINARWHPYRFGFNGDTGAADA